MAKPTKPKVMKVNLWLRVEGNNKYVRGKKKARAEIEQFVLARFGMEKLRPDGWEYVLTIPYETEDGVGGTWRVYAVTDDESDARAPALAVQVDDSSDGTAWLIVGGAAGVTRPDACKPVATARMVPNLTVG